MPAAVIFDMDGVLIDSEDVWDASRRALAQRAGVAWPGDATDAMQGMSSPEWSRYMRDTVGVEDRPEAISAAVVAEMERRYAEHLPMIAGAPEAVARLAAHWPLGLASSANREVIDLVIREAGLDFGVTVSSEEVPRGKPAPDVYVEAARRMGHAPQDCVAIEDSSNGLRSASAAGLRVIAIPAADYPPAADALALADVVLGSIAELDAAVVRGL